MDRWLERFLFLAIIGGGLFWYANSNTDCAIEKAKLPSEGWGPVTQIHPCPDNDPLGLFTNADCDPVKPKKMPTLEEMAKCTREQFYADPRQCM
jgi:hypothetical protein